MKFLGILLACLLLIISCWPCADAGNCIHSHDATTHNHAAHHNTSQNDGDEAADACSPFCQCNCCQLMHFFNDIQTASLILPPTPIGVVFNTYYEAALITKDYPIWQPPQLIG